MIDADAQWFADHPDRQARIRNPVKIVEIDKQRAAHYVDECGAEFMSLGPHDRDRRRILLWRVPNDNPFYKYDKPPILKIPMLAFADETIEDVDHVLLPVIDGLMREQRQRYA
jgi:hypothetical protein